MGYRASRVIGLWGPSLLWDQEKKGQTLDFGSAELYNEGSIVQRWTIERVPSKGEYRMGTTKTATRVDTGADNYLVDVSDDFMVITIDLRKAAMDDAGEVIRTSGGNIRVASSRGNTLRAGNIKGGFNVYKKE